MALATNLGYPRIGAKRELKKALESYWAGKSSAVELEAASRELRLRHWRLQRERGIQHIPSNDSSLYDHVLDTAALAGAVPARFNWDGDRVDLNTYFAMARGSDATPAMEMTKWFNTNYHYIVPEFEPGQRFRLASRKPLDEFREAQAEGIHSRPKLLGPVSFLLLGKTRQGGPEPLSLLESLLPVYEELLAELAAAGADWIQIDEPCLVLDLTPQAQAAFRDAYARLGALSSRLRLLLTTYFGDLRENLPTALALPVAGLHLDLVRGSGGLDPTLAALPADCVLSLGLIDGRNVWRTDLDQALATLQRAQAALGPERLFVAPSCSLLHVPVDLDQESALDPELRSWLSFADQKIDELTLLTRALNEGPASVAESLAHQRRALESRRRSQRTRAPAVRQRTAAIDAAMLQRANPYPQRRALQRARLQLPLLPTTTIGSFPQTPEIRRARARFRNGRLAAADYETFLEAEIDHVIRFQEEIGLDVLVHGEPERSDMSEYFGERLDGIAVTAHGWVQSYGSRCARPPIIYGDVSRPTPMTVRWARYAQSRTTRPVKGMLTGPLTLLQWSFVRDDQPRRETARQLALALRDEVAALEAAGLKIIQIDEPALREGLPLRRDQWPFYLAWAVEAFRLAAAGVRDETQIQTHVCYAEFDDIVASIAAMDADVILIEASRSAMDLDAFAALPYPNEIGLGVYDIHSPRVPSQHEIEALLRKALALLPPEQVWVNPDCGLKTRRWEEVGPSLRGLVAAAHLLRESAAPPPPTGAG